MPYISNRIPTAQPGYVWVLCHRYREPSVFSGAMDTSIGVYLHPWQAIHDLARQIRPHWDSERDRAASQPGRPPLPPDMPDDDYAAVALFFADPGHDENRIGYHTYSLEPHSIDTTHPPASTHAHEYVLVHPFREFTCLCGNAPHLTGFEDCDPDGRILPDGPAAGWNGHVLCPDCGRIIATATGLITGRLAGPAGSRVELDTLAEALRRRGHDTVVESTGGNVATLYAGTRAPEHGTQSRWAAAIGPGWFDGPAQTPVADLTELYVGPDDEDTWSVPAARHATTDEIVALIIAVIDHVNAQPARFTRACETARDAMWVAFAGQYPEITTGDLEPGVDLRLVDESTRLFALWLTSNRAEHTVPSHILALAQSLAKGQPC